MTLFTTVYEAFFSLITDDMYMEITKEETERDCRSLLMASIPLFEFPNEVLHIDTKTELDLSITYFFTNDLTLEEINILAMGMNQIWLQRQITSVELVRQKFSGTDFKLTSQASHLSRLIDLLEKTKVEHRRLQMLHSRRRVNRKGEYESTFGMLVERMKS